MASCSADTIAFVQLKVACNHLIQVPTMESTERLIEIINKVPTSSVQNMHGHVLFVLLQKLQEKTIRSNVKIKLVECMKLVLLCCKHLNFEPALLDNLILCFMGVMYDPESDNLLTTNPEELHTLCLKCISILLCQAKPKERAQLYSAKRAPLLGVLVCVCLKQASVQQYRELKVTAIECLMACGQVLESAQTENQELRIQTSNIFINFTPGIAAGLQQVICADEKQAHHVTVIALRAWGRLLAQVLNEDILPPGVSSFSVKKELITSNTLSSAKTSVEMENLIMQSQRTAAWLSHADSKLAGNVCKVCSVNSHPNHKVRLELVFTAELLLTKCSRAVPHCVPPLLEVLVALAEDKENEVSNAAENALTIVAHKCESDCGKDLAEILEDNFFSRTSNLASHFIHADKEKQHSSLGLLLGYLRLLGPRLSDTLLLSSHCESLLDALLQVSTLDCTSVLLLEDIAVRDVSSAVMSRPWCRFRYFSDAEVFEKLNQVCHMLSEQVNYRIICEQLLQVFHERVSQRREATFLLNHILSHVHSVNTMEHHNIVKTVLRAYLDPGVWDVSLSMHESSSSVEIVTLASIRGNVVQACLMTEGLALLAASTETMTRRVLAQILYPMLERAGSPLELVSQAGRQGLAIIAHALGHNSPAQLIEQEADYFSHTVELRLRRPQDNPGALLVLSAVLTHSNKDLLPCIQQLISNVLVQSCDTFQERSMTSYLHVFRTFLVNLQRWLLEDQEKENTMEVEIPNRYTETPKSLLIEELRLHHKWKYASGEEEENETEEVQDETIISEETEKHVPEYVKMTEAVMLRCIHSLPVHDRDKQLLALSCLKYGVKILAGHEDQLLPMVHKIWSPLLQRFSPNQDIVVLRQSFQLLCTMAHLAKDFLRKRTLDKVLPIITEFLIKQAPASKKQRTHMFCQTVKLQRVALENLGQLAENLGLQEEAQDLILCSAAPYLSVHQPILLQENCIGLFRHLIRLSPDLVWLHLRLLWNSEQQLTSPYSSFPVVRFSRSTLDALEFKKNVTLLEAEM